MVIILLVSSIVACDICIPKVRCAELRAGGSAPVLAISYSDSSIELALIEGEVKDYIHLLIYSKVLYNILNQNDF